MRGLLPLILLQIPNPVDGLGTRGRIILTDVLLILGAGILLSMVLVVWAVRYVQRGRRRRRHHHQSRPAIPEHSVDSGKASRRRRHRRRRRRSGQEHRPRNPSLAETGGLPPVRSEDSSAPPIP